MPTRYTSLSKVIGGEIRAWEILESYINYQRNQGNDEYTPNVAVIRVGNDIHNDPHNKYNANAEGVFSKVLGFNVKPMDLTKFEPDFGALGLDNNGRVPNLGQGEEEYVWQHVNKLNLEREIANVTTKMNPWMAVNEIDYKLFPGNPFDLNRRGYVINGKEVHFGTIDKNKLQYVSRAAAYDATTDDGRVIGNGCICGGTQQFLDKMAGYRSDCVVPEVEIQHPELAKSRTGKVEDWEVRHNAEPRDVSDPTLAAIEMEKRANKHYVTFPKITGKPTIDMDDIISWAQQRSRDLSGLVIDGQRKLKDINSAHNFGMAADYEAIPKHIQILATSTRLDGNDGRGTVEIIWDPETKTFGVQFHPENAAIAAKKDSIDRWFNIGLIQVGMATEARSAAYTRVTGLEFMNVLEGVLGVPITGNQQKISMEHIAALEKETSFTLNELIENATIERMRVSKKVPDLTRREESWCQGHSI